MSSLPEFLRRNRGKVVAGVFIAGGTYLAQKYIRRYLEERERQAADERNLASAAANAFGVTPERMMLQNRRMYVFDSNHRTCDNSILQIIPSIKTKLQNRFDVEELVDSLKRSPSDDALGNEKKFEIWNQMAVDAVARLLSSSISYTILVISLKTQISILAAQIYDNSVQSVPGRIESWYSRMWYAMGGRPQPVSVGSGRQAKSRADVDPLKNSANVQQLFLQALQFFTNKGVDSLNDFIRPIVADQLSGYSLKDTITFEQLKKLFQTLLTKAVGDGRNGRHFSFYVVPMWQTGTSFEEPKLEELLIILKTVLESPEAQQLFNFGMQQFIDAALKFVSNALPGFSGPSGQKSDDSPSSSPSTDAPLARLIPIFTDAFHDISRVNFDSVINNFIISQELHEFCMKVYDRDQNIW